MGRKAYTEPQCLYKGALYLTFSVTSWVLSCRPSNTGVLSLKGLMRQTGVKPSSISPSARFLESEGQDHYWTSSFENKFVGVVINLIWKLLKKGQFIKMNCIWDKPNRPHEELCPW
jgi:hypothetical protein